MELRKETVHNIFIDCMLGMDDVISRVEPVIISWYDMHIGFHPDKLTRSRQAIEELLLRLNPRFRDGCSIKHLHSDDTGRKWGDVKSVTELVCLGLAIGACDKIVSETMGDRVPEAVPYLKLARKEDDRNKKEDMEAAGSDEGSVFEVWSDPDYDR